MPEPRVDGVDMVLECSPRLWRCANLDPAGDVVGDEPARHEHEDVAGRGVLQQQVLREAKKSVRQLLPGEWRRAL